jgi:hypothetical protein
VSLHPRDRQALEDIERAAHADDPQLAHWLAGRTRWRYPKRFAAAAYLVAPGVMVLGILLGLTVLVTVGAVLAVATPAGAWRMLRPRSRAAVTTDTLDDL